MILPAAPRALFDACQQGPWTRSGDDVWYRLEEHDDGLLLLFPGTPDEHGWLHDFDVAIDMYKGMGTPFRVHRGFARLWQSVHREVIARIIASGPAEGLTIAGYSQGAALATLAHEDIGYNLPHLPVATHAFASPRLLWMPAKAIRKRFMALTRWSVRGDLVTLVPPAWAGYRHVGGEDNKLGPFALPWWTHHLPQEYQRNLP
jgi:hypothetical protein